MKKSFYHISLIVLAALILGSGCKKLVDVDPPVTYVDGKVAYASNANAIAVLSGLYMNLVANSEFAGSNGLSFCAGLTADELQAYSASDIASQLYYQNAYTSLDANPGTPPFWDNLYSRIYITNSAISGNNRLNHTVSCRKETIIRRS